MTPWVLRLNDITPQLAGRLPPSDTRLRPDVRALEAGVYDQARSLGMPCRSGIDGVAFQRSPSTCKAPPQSTMGHASLKMQ